MRVETELKELLNPVLKEFIELHELDAETEQYQKARLKSLCVSIDENGKLGFLYSSSDYYPNNFVASETINGLKREIEIINDRKTNPTKNSKK